MIKKQIKIKKQINFAFILILSILIISYGYAISSRKHKIFAITSDNIGLVAIYLYTYRKWRSCIYYLKFSCRKDTTTGNFAMDIAEQQSKQKEEIILYFDIKADASRLMDLQQAAMTLLAYFTHRKTKSRNWDYRNNKN